MKKVGIISQFNMNNVNYGNRLQAFALNCYLREHYPQCKVESLHFQMYDKALVTCQVSAWKRVVQKCYRLCLKIVGKTRMTSKVALRKVRCNTFSQNHMQLCERALNWESLRKCDYDVMIVGSDVVWAQARSSIGRIRFLDFNLQKPYKKIAYAASFGRDWIPEENVADIRRCLQNFDYISVRENSSIDLLKGIGINNALHTLDPTLLIDAKHWEEIEKQPITSAEKSNTYKENQYIGTEKFVFVYLLGQDKKTRQAIQAWAKEKKLRIVTIPYASGFSNSVDRGFGNIRLMDCAPEEWLWLIHHAEVIITDSFHGTVFSTIFQKRYIVVEREYEENINNRMIDFLKEINWSDKLLAIEKLYLFDFMTWDYQQVNEILLEKRDSSEEYIRKALGDL